MIRRTRLIVATAAISMLLAGCGGSHDMADMATPSGTSGASVADAMFAQMMIPHHQQAVEMSTLAETRASSPEIKELAAEIKAAQQPEIDQMTAWLEEWGVPVMPMDEAMGEHGGHGMSGMLTDEQMQQLADSSGPEFDRLFAEFMIEHHEGAIDMAEDVVDSKDPRVAALAAEIIATQAEEIAQLRAFLEGSGSAAGGDASASPSVVALATGLDHAHAATFLGDELLVGTHTGMVRIDTSTGAVELQGTSRDDFMGLAAGGSSLVASGHPGAGSTLPDPLGLILSRDAGLTWDPISLTGQIDFHALAAAGDSIAGSATAGQILHSIDGGRTWKSIAEGEAVSLAWHGDRLWLADGNTLSSWAPGESALRPENVGRAVYLATSPQDSLWALLADGSVHMRESGSWVSRGSVDEIGPLAVGTDLAVVVTTSRLFTFPVGA